MNGILFTRVWSLNQKKQKKQMFLLTYYYLSPADSCGFIYPSWIDMSLGFCLVLSHCNLTVYFVGLSQNETCPLGLLSDK